MDLHFPFGPSHPKITQRSEPTIGSHQTQWHHSPFQVLDPLFISQDDNGVLTRTQLSLPRSTFSCQVHCVGEQVACCGNRTVLLLRREAIDHSSFIFSFHAPDWSINVLYSAFCQFSVFLSRCRMMELFVLINTFYIVAIAHA